MTQAWRYVFAAGRMDEAEKELAQVQPDTDSDARVAALTQGIAFARAGKGGPGEAELKARLAAAEPELVFEYRRKLSAALN